ncbi:MAG: DUF2254 domain-containing protein [Verrucomicrobiota bacterium]|nr:DUF2254 domain-containing protein [Verrucomicrobiota bacterium]
MKVFISAWWERLRTSYWFIPGLLALSATALSFLTVHIDALVNAKWVRATGWIWAGSAEGARNVLATIAGSAITVAGVIFSITIVSLTLASSQFGPRLLRNFMADRATQFVLGIFVSSFLYCLLVLRTIRGTGETQFVPYLSVTCGLIFAVVSVGFLIFFIHHVSNSILAENLIVRVARELEEGIERLFPEAIGDGAASAIENDGQTLPQTESFSLLAPANGFIQAIDAEHILHLATKRNLVVRLHRRPGDFVARESRLAEVWPKEEASRAALTDMIEAYYFGRTRTPTQDVEYSIDQLVEVAVRALSPGINDPFTAITCLEWLGVALSRVGNRKMPSRYRCDDDGKLRVVSDVTDFRGLASAALDQIRQYGCSSMAVTLRMLDVVGRVCAEIASAENRATLFEHAEKIRDDGVAAVRNQRDGAAIEEKFREVTA